VSEPLRPLRRDRLVGREGPPAQGHRHRRGARRRRRPAWSGPATSGRARRCWTGCSKRAAARSRPCSASTSASRRRSPSAANICPASRACRTRARILGLCRRQGDDEDLGAASFLEQVHRRHFYFGIADGVKADFVRFRQCDARLNAQGGRKTASAYDAIGAAQVAKASFSGMRLLHRIDGKVAIWPMDPLPGPRAARWSKSTPASTCAAPACRHQAAQPRRAQPALKALGSPPRAAALRARRPPDRRAGHRRRHARARTLAARPRLRARRAHARDRAQPKAGPSGSSLPTSPRSSACRQPASTAPPSGQSSMPSSRAASRPPAGSRLPRPRCGAAAVAHRAQDQEVADRLGHADAGGDGRRAFPALGELVAALERPDDRRAAGPPAPRHPRPLGPDQPDASSSSNAFHMPIRPVPPPVG
jgi:hypothetical protein